MLASKTSLADARVTETPNASMSTLASPTQGGTSTLSLWRVTMSPGQKGPQHTFDVEQAWHVLGGDAMFVVDAAPFELSTGDTLVLPAGVRRQVSTESGVEFVVTGLAGGSATAFSPDGPRDSVRPGWIV